MSVAEKFTISDETAKGLSKGLAEGSFKVRAFVYILIYFPLLIVTLFTFLLQFDNPKYGLSATTLWIITFSIPLIPIYLIEKMIRRRRRKEGLPIYKSIDKILKQRAIDERVAMEVKAQEKVSPSKDLNYYFELKEKGAITQEEYDAKKAEFLK